MGNIFAKSGGIDVRRAEAEVMAKERYTSHCFRGRGRNPLNPPNGGRDPVDLSNITKHNTTCTKACAAWNFGNDHQRKHVDANGRCRYKHACMQWVTDKGKDGQCLGDHQMPFCTYDPAKKCDSPVKA